MEDHLNVIAYNQIRLVRASLVYDLSVMRDNSYGSTKKIKARKIKYKEEWMKENLYDITMTF